MLDLLIPGEGLLECVIYSNIFAFFVKAENAASEL